MKAYRIVQSLSTGFVQNETDDIIAFMEARGHNVTGYNKSPMVRQEIRNQPRFDGFCGPMWDGTAIRYEDSETNNALSA